MAEAKQPDTEDKDEGKSSKKGASGNLIKIISITFGAILLLVITSGMTAYFMSKMIIGHTGDSEDNSAVVDKPSKKDKQKDAKGKSKEKKPALYFAFEPAFVVNFPQSGEARYLQLTVEVMTREEDVMAALEAHKPRIRNNLVLLFSSQHLDEIKTVEGKQKMRELALEEVQKVMNEEIGKPGVEEVYFTSFVMQ